MAKEKQLEEMSVKELLGLHNAYNKDKPLKSWSKAKSILIGRIRKIQLPKAKPVRGALAEFCIPLVAHVDHYIDPDGNVCEKDTPGAQAVGLSYEEMLRRVKEKFPTTGHNYACLRWYACKMREKGMFVPPHRPASKWKKEKK